jgi:hypothetical protein
MRGTMAAVAVRSAGVLLLGVAVLAGCGDDDAGEPGGSGGTGGGETASPSPSSSPSPEPTEEDQPAWHEAGAETLPAFRIRLPAGATWHQEPVELHSDEACEGPGWRAEQDGAGIFGTLFTVASPATSCQIDPEVNADPTNGRHPAYRTADDIPPEVAGTAIEVDTPLGPALVFSQTYTECTNACEDFDEPFVVVTLDEPADPAHPALVFTSAYGQLGEEDLAEIVTDGIEPG